MSWRNYTHIHVLHSIKGHCYYGNRLHWIQHQDREDWTQHIFMKQWVKPVQDMLPYGSMSASTLRIFPVLLWIHSESSRIDTWLEVQQLLIKQRQQKRRESLCVRDHSILSMLMTGCLYVIPYTSDTGRQINFEGICSNMSWTVKEFMMNGLLNGLDIQIEVVRVRAC